MIQDLDAKCCNIANKFVLHADFFLLFRQMEDPPLKSLKFLSQSTDSLHKTSKVTESTESLTDEGKTS